MPIWDWLRVRLLTDYMRTLDLHITHLPAPLQNADLINLFISCFKKVLPHAQVPPTPPNIQRRPVPPSGCALPTRAQVTPDPFPVRKIRSALRRPAPLILATCGTDPFRPALHTSPQYGATAFLCADATSSIPMVKISTLSQF